MKDSLVSLVVHASVHDQDTNKVVKHIEAWDVEPSRVVKELLKPASKTPQNEWEEFFASLSTGNSQGMWFASSKYVAIAWLPIVVISLATKVATGEGLQVSSAPQLDSSFSIFVVEMN